MVFYLFLIFLLSVVPQRRPVVVCIAMADEELLHEEFAIEAVEGDALAAGDDGDAATRQAALDAELFGDDDDDAEPAAGGAAAGAGEAEEEEAGAGEAGDDAAAPAAPGEAHEQEGDEMNLDEPAPSGRGARNALKAKLQRLAAGKKADAGSSLSSPARLSPLRLTSIRREGEEGEAQAGGGARQEGAGAEAGAARSAAQARPRARRRGARRRRRRPRGAHGGG